MARRACLLAALGLSIAAVSATGQTWYAPDLAANSTFVASGLEWVNATEKDHQKTTETPQLSARCLDRIGSVESASYSNVGPTWASWMC